MSQIQSNYPRDVLPTTAKVDLFSLQSEGQALVVGLLAIGLAAGILQMAAVAGHPLPENSFIRAVARFVLTWGPFYTMYSVFRWSRRANDCVSQLRGYASQSNSLLVGLSCAFSWLCLFLPLTIFLDFIAIRTEDAEGQIMRWYLPISRSPLVIGFAISSALWLVLDVFSTPRYADKVIEKGMITGSVALYFVAFYCLSAVINKVQGGLVDLAKQVRAMNEIQGAPDNAVPILASE